MEISPTDNLDQPYPLSAQQFFEDCENHRDNLFNFAKRMAGNTLGSEVEDLVQSTIIKAVENRNQFTPGTNLKAWLMRIMHNLFLNSNRRSKRIVLYDQVLNQDEACTEPFEEPVRPKINAVDTISQNLCLRLKSAISEDKSIPIEEVDKDLISLLDMSAPTLFLESYYKVNREYRVVFALIDFLDFEYSEVSTILGVPLGTVMSRLFRARRNFSEIQDIRQMGSFYGLGNRTGKRPRMK